MNGAFYIPFKEGELEKARDTFSNMLKRADIIEKESAILCRSVEWSAKWCGEKQSQGQGIVKSLVEAAIYRDQAEQFAMAFEAAALAIAGLLDEKHKEMISCRVTFPGDSDARQMRRMIWEFVRNPDTGLPSSNLLADTEWHPLMVKRVKNFLDMISKKFDLTLADNIGNKLAKRKMENRPIIAQADLAQAETLKFRVSTVHKVKGESIDGVMYAASKNHAEAFLDGINSELGRIGYVALTRARNLFVLAIPQSAVSNLKPRLLDLGFKKPSKH